MAGKEYVLLQEAKNEKEKVARKIEALLREYYEAYELVLDIEVAFHLIETIGGNKRLADIVVNLRAEL
jgi:hypothetical protein